jgi:hypothetical protein
LKLPHLTQILGSYSANPSENESLLFALQTPSDRSWILDVLLEALMLTPLPAGTEPPKPVSGDLFGLDRSLSGLTKLKLSIMKFILCGAFKSNEVHCHELAALCDSSHETVSQGELVARRLGSADRDDSSVVVALLQLFSRPNASLSLKVNVVNSLGKSSTAPQHHFVGLVKVCFPSVALHEVFTL